MSMRLDAARLRRENRVFADTLGTSPRNRSDGFLPAFLDTETGRVELARFADGRVAPMHLIDGLPREWAEDVDAAGRIVAVKSSVVSGFVREGCFFTRAQLAALSQSA